MPQEATIGELFEVTIALEKSAEAVYQGLQARFGHVPEVANFWKRYAAEEAGHARALERLRDGLNPDRLKQPTEPRMLEEGRRLLRISPEQHLQGVANLENAYQLASKLESSEVNALFDFLMTEFLGEKETPALLRGQLREHVDKLISEFPPNYREKAVRARVQAINQG